MNCRSLLHTNRSNEESTKGNRRHRSYSKSFLASDKKAQKSKRPTTPTGGSKKVNLVEEDILYPLNIDFHSEKVRKILHKYLELITKYNLLACSH